MQKTWIEQLLPPRKLSSLYHCSWYVVIVNNYILLLLSVHFAVQLWASDVESFHLVSICYLRPQASDQSNQIHARQGTLNNWVNYLKWLHSWAIRCQKSEKKGERQREACSWWNINEHKVLGWFFSFYHYFCFLAVLGKN